MYKRQALVRLPSGEMRNVPVNCTAVIGQVSNIDHENVNLGKAGRKRHMGVRPGSRGTVMNPCDHPHGGGEGRAPVGHSGPMLSLIHISSGWAFRSLRRATMPPNFR